jgi:hypothetical protein
MNQGEFNFDEGLPYQAHSETSRDAAESMEPSAATMRGKVLAFIRQCGRIGATDDEMQVHLHMNPSTQRPRRVELWTAGLIEASGRKRLTRSRCNAMVWVEKP